MTQGASALGNAIRNARIQKGYTQGTVIRTAEYYAGAFETYGGRPPESLRSPPLPDDGAAGLLRGRTGVPGAGGERRAPHGGADGPAGGGPLPADRHYENVKQRFERWSQTAVFL